MKKTKLYISLIVVAAFIIGIGATVNAGVAVKVFVNGNSVSEQAKIIDGTVYLPLKTISENLGATYEINNEKNTITVKSEEGSVPAVVNKVGPSVVGIMGKIKQSSSHYMQGSDNLIFGTGVVYKADGYIITNAHVVKDMESIVVVLSNSKSYMARLKAIDEKFDLAMIKIDKGGLTPAVFGDMTDVSVGEPVLAIGTPLSFSLRNSASKGIISGINRSVEGEYRFIQSDAAINSGNSGGPLVDMNGAVIGINSVKFTGFGVEGLNFSIPVDTVKYVINQFEKYGKVRRPYLGVAFSEGVAARYGLPSINEGLTITKVEKGSPAEKAKLLVDDIVKEINGVELPTKVDYNEELKKYLPRDTVDLKVDRDGIEKTIKVTFGEENN